MNDILSRTYKQIDFNALENIEPGETKSLVIAATGTGKTYMSAFDVMKYAPEKLLF